MTKRDKDASTAKQKLLVEYLISNRDLFQIAAKIVEPKYFTEELQPTVKFLHEYYSDYNSTPTPKQIEAETGAEFDTVDITRDQLNYCLAELETFCRNKALESAIIEGASLIGTNNSGKIQKLISDAIEIRLDSDLGMDYFSDPQERIDRMLEETHPASTGWAEVDKLLDGGINRKQLQLFSANSGGGKSIVMANMAYNFVRQGMSVLYVTLELDQDMVAKRFDSIMTGIPQVEWKAKNKQVSEALADLNIEANLKIKYMPSGTKPSALRGYLKEYELVHKHLPDLLIVDYMGLMGTDEKVSQDNMYIKDKIVSEALRNIASDLDLHLVTASQQNRGAVQQTETYQSSIAGGISKIETADNYISIVMTDAMRAQGEMSFKFNKTRSSDGVGKTVNLKWNASTLRISDLDRAPAVEFKPKPRVKEAFNNDDPSASQEDLLSMIGSF